MIPKIIFRYSETYDQILRESYEFHGLHKKKGDRVKKWHSLKEILSNIEKIEKVWKKDEKKS